jgi:hypothetical protein
MMSRLPEQYPDAPGYKSTGTSEQAARAIERTAKTLRERVLRAFQEVPNGLTADAVADRLGKSVLSVRPRVSELHRAGEIRPAGGRGKNDSGMSAIVWVVSPPLPGPSNGEGR